MIFFSEFAQEFNQSFKKAFILDLSYQIFRDPVPRQANGNIPAHFSELWIRPRTALSISFHGMDPRSLHEKMFSLNPTLSEVTHPTDHEGSSIA